MSPPWFLEAGARLQSDNSVRFTLWAPHASAALPPRVRVCTGPARGDYPMQPAEAEPGTYAALVPNVGAGADYVFVLDDDRELPDPVSRWQPNGVHGPSRVVDPEFEWKAQYWIGTPMDEIIAYELHVGTFTPEGTFAAIVPRLSELKELGIRAIELMPVAQFPGDRNWGYDGVFPYAVQNSYGGPIELKKLIDAAHEHRIGVILDVVYNHVGPEGNVLDEFGPYFTDRYETPWGRTFNFDGPDSDAVRRYIVDNACYWVTEFQVDGLRLDAAHGMFDLGAVHILEEIAAAVHARASELRKTIVVIAESDLNDPRLLRQPDDGGYGLDAQWSDDFHHAIHAAFTGESGGYYCDFGPVGLIADALREPFVYDGRYSKFRRRSHGRPSTGLPSDHFVVAMQNHDQIGNRACGERLATLLTPAQLRIAAVLLLLSPYVPMLFMGEEYGETNPFQYFVSHGDEELVAAVRNGRRAEFAAFAEAADFPDPQADATYNRSKIDWSKRENGQSAQLLALHRDLLALRRDEYLLRPDRAQIIVDDGASGWITILREPVDDWADSQPSILTVYNCSGEPLDVPVPDSTGRAWTMRLGTDAAAYGGNAELAERIQADGETDGPRRLVDVSQRTVRMPPWTAAVYIAERSGASYPGR
jgi:maltooligosyltrehalose trehalohydrolase